MSNLEGGRPDIMWVVMKGGEEGVRRGGRGSRMMVSTHICGSVSSIVPDVVHQAGQVLQAVWDVVREEKDAHRLTTGTQKSGSNMVLATVLVQFFSFFFLIHHAHRTCGHVSM